MIETVPLLTRITLALEPGWATRNAATVSVYATTLGEGYKCIK